MLGAHGASIRGVSFKGSLCNRPSDSHHTPIASQSIKFCKLVHPQFSTLFCMLFVLLPFSESLLLFSSAISRHHDASTEGLPFCFRCKLTCKGHTMQRGPRLPSRARNKRRIAKSRAPTSSLSTPIPSIVPPGRRMAWTVRPSSSGVLSTGRTPRGTSRHRLDGRETRPQQLTIRSCFTARGYKRC